MLPVNTIPKNSFSFNFENTFERFGIKCIASHLLSPTKRNRSKTIPFRDGTLDLGRKFYNNRTIQLNCQTTRPISQNELDELTYLLSVRGRLEVWDRPDKYYVGELLRSVQLDIAAKYAFQSFTLEMYCEPFGYIDMPTLTVPANNVFVPINYRGTRRTPCIISMPGNATLWATRHTDIRGEIITEPVRVDYEGDVIVDSERMLVNQTPDGDNLIHLRDTSGIWVFIDRFTRGFSIDATRGAMITYRERYLL